MTPSLGPTYYEGHEPVIPPVIVTGVPRIDDIWLERFADAPVTDIGDAVGALYVMSPTITPLYRPMRRLVGQALTVKAWPGDNLAIHGAMAMVQPGDVLVIDWRGHTASCGSGARRLVLPARHGLRGVVIDGAWRDIEDLRAADFPIYGVARSAFSPPKRRPGEINTAVACGGVVVSAGDLVVGDSEGVVVVPAQYLSIVWEAVNATGSSERMAEALDGRWAKFHNAFVRAGGVERTWQG